MATTGNYPGKARNADELRRDLDKAYSLIPGTHRLNLHAIYAETGGQQVPRNQLQPDLGYAIDSQVLLCLDSGHFHPTEVISDKIPSVLLYVDKILLHVSHGVRWDSDHVVTLSEELQAIMQEIVRGGFLDRVHIGLDFFDASINRVAAWVIGTRNALRALLMALLEPGERLRGLEIDGGYTARLALLEELKNMPLGAVWDHHCLTQGVPIGMGFIDEIRAYERDVLSQRT